MGIFLFVSKAKQKIPIRHGGSMGTVRSIMGDLPQKIKGLLEKGLIPKSVKSVAIAAICAMVYKSMPNVSNWVHFGVFLAGLIAILIIVRFPD